MHIHAAGFLRRKASLLLGAQNARCTVPELWIVKTVARKTVRFALLPLLCFGATECLQHEVGIVR